MIKWVSQPPIWFWLGKGSNSFRDFDPFNLQRSAGLGIRIFMPAFGLLGIDFGKPFDPLPSQNQIVVLW